MGTTVMPSPLPRLQARRSVLRPAGVMMIALALGACIPRGRPALEQPSQPAAAQAEPARLSRLPAGETRNRVAVLVPLSGATGGLGQSILNAANLALADTGGERIRIMPYDTARGAAQAMTAALADGSGLILGPLLAEDVRVAAPLARASGVPVIAFSNDTSVAGDGVYLIGLNPAQSIDRVVRHARAQGMRRFSALLPTGLYGDRAGQAFRASVREAGGELVGVQSYDRAPSALRAAAQRLAGAGAADAVLIADGTRVAVQAAPLLRDAGGAPRLLGTELWAGEASVGASAALRGAWYAAPADGLFDQFRSRYRTQYNSAPQRLATLGYDATLLALRAAGDWPLGRDFPVRALRGADGFIGVDGAFRFGRDAVAERALEVREVTAAGVRVVSAAPRGF